MFTGLIEETATLARREAHGVRVSLWFKATAVFDDLKLGDSLNHDGCCLTVAELAPPLYRCDVTAETLSRSTLGDVAIGGKVNIERALAVGQRLGGHLVLGHVDGVGRIERLEPSAAEVVLAVWAPNDLRPYLAPKGSVAVDGISLTVVEVSGATFTVSLIPHTLAMTTLVDKQAGQRVNLEGDVLARYVVRALACAGTDTSSVQRPDLSLERLADLGF